MIEHNLENVGKFFDILKNRYLELAIDYRDIDDYEAYEFYSTKVQAFEYCARIVKNEKTFREDWTKYIEERRATK